MKNIILPIANIQQQASAYALAKNFVDNNPFYSSIKSISTNAIMEYILSTQGLSVARNTDSSTT